MINRRREIAGSATAFDDVFPALVGCADETPRLDAAAGPEIRVSARPVIATRLLRSGRSTGVAAAGTHRIADLGRASELSGHDDQHALVESALVNTEANAPVFIINCNGS